MSVKVLISMPTEWVSSYPMFGPEILVETTAGVRLPYTEGQQINCIGGHCKGYWERIEQPVGMSIVGL